ncbi:hypothetical protein ATY81_22420 [Rhizobium sp. R72]|uniref:hypothetical protein n=1 Tax=unclassified Rhizobium TaxID=2613769 RepID=UPI000B537C1A|nr:MULTISPECIES: hypothetical protein [unclassified Rhizobium]OWW02393.1 hypothetical protein ATY81_22420 [Rhizobium sp. R72]OWW02527.1 hypothetical protein ATY80_22420 [Rhizobium sp. R711]
MYTEADLMLADRHVAQAEKHVFMQEVIIGRLLRSGLPTDIAEALLVTFNEALSTHRARKNSIAAQLDH